MPEGTNSTLARLAEALEKIEGHLSSLVEIEQRAHRKAWTTAEVATSLGYDSTGPVRRLIRSGDLATVEGCDEYRVTQSEVDRFVEHSTTSAAARKAKRRRTGSNIRAV